MMNNVAPTLQQIEEPVAQNAPDTKQQMILQMLSAGAQQNMVNTNLSNGNHNHIEDFKKKKKNAKIKKAIGIILLILAILAIIGAVFFLYKAFKSRHDAIEAEKNNPKYNELKNQISKDNNTFNNLTEQLNKQKNSNEILFSNNGKEYKAIFNPETKTYNLFEKNSDGIFSETPIDTITAENNVSMFEDLQSKLQTQRESNILMLGEDMKAEFDQKTKQWNIYQKTADGFDVKPSQSITSGDDNNTLFSDLQQKLQSQQTSNEFIYTKDDKTYKAVYNQETGTYSLFEQNEQGEFLTSPSQTITKQWNKDIFDDLQQKLQSQHTSNQITFEQDGKTLKAVFDKETNTFNIFEESEFATQSSTSYSLTSLNGKEIPFTSNGKQMKYVYDEAKDCFNIFEAGKNGKFSKYPIGSIEYKTAEEINKLKHIDFPKYMKKGAPALGGGVTLGAVSGIMLTNANNEQRDAETQEQISTLNLLSQTPYSGNNINRQQYNTPEIQAVNNATTAKYNIAGVNQSQEVNDMRGK